ncbi:hypothetical protein FDB42_12530 [Clostridium botulinum]|nr:hypothetical protein [Clostridium botulinum]NFO40906.1 hypothetical protein [Clostridium botulinum]
MFEINIVNNTRLALEVTEEYFKKIIKEPNEVKNYKMIILNLHNALELTFKLMIYSRNDFMIYSMHDSNSYEKLIRKFKQARNCRNKGLTIENPFEDSLHTVTFKTAYEILSYLYKVEELDDKFIFELKKLENLRNSLMHYKACIEETDIILLYSMFKKCVTLYNEEMQRDTYDLHRILKSKEYVCFDLDYNLEYQLNNNIDNICLKILDRDIIKMLVSCLIKKIGYINEDIRLDDYENLCEFFKKEANDKLKKVFKNHQDEKTSYENFILNGIYIMLEANFMYSKTYYDIFGLDVLAGISLSTYCKDIVLRKYKYDETSICSNFELNKEEYNSLINMDEKDDNYNLVDM